MFYLLHSTLVLSFHIDVVLTLSIQATPSNFYGWHNERYIYEHRNEHVVASLSCYIFNLGCKKLYYIILYFNVLLVVEIPICGK